MIRSIEGKTDICGGKAEILADLGVIANAINKNFNVPKSEIMQAVELGLMPMEQLDRIALEKLMKMLLGGK